MAAAWPRSISRKCACKIPKGNMGYDQYTVCNDCSCRTYFLLLSFVLANIWRYAGASFTLGARDFSSAVSGFCQVFIVTRARGFFWRLRPTAEDVSAFGQDRKFPPYARKASGTQGTINQTTDFKSFLLVPESYHLYVNAPFDFRPIYTMSTFFLEKMHTTL